MIRNGMDPRAANTAAARRLTGSCMHSHLPNTPNLCLADADLPRPRRPQLISWQARTRRNEIPALSD